MNKTTSKKWLPWIGCYGIFDMKTGKLHLTLAKVANGENTDPYCVFLGENPLNRKEVVITMQPGRGSIGYFPKKYVVLPKV